MGKGIQPKDNYMKKENNYALYLEKIGDVLSKKLVKQIEPTVLNLDFADLIYDFFQKYEDRYPLLEKQFTLHETEERRSVRDDGSVHYNLNSGSFRCDEFTKNHSKKHLLFMGCSETMGVGANLDEAWAYILYNKIKDPLDLGGYFNIALSGSSFIQQIMTYYRYEEEFGKPDTIVFLAPDIFRGYMKYDKLDKSFEDIVQAEATHIIHSTAMFSEKLVIEEVYLQFMINAISAIRQFEVYCKSHNIKLIWSAWYQSESFFFEKLKFENFFPMYEGPISPGDMYKKYPQYIKYNDPKKDLFKRDMHHGPLYHSYWADSFLKQIEKDI